MYETKTKDGHKATILHRCTGAIVCYIGYITLDDGSQVPCTWAANGGYTSRFIYEGNRLTSFDVEIGDEIP